MADEGNWCLIESDPGVFTELISNMGCQGVQVEEIWSLDDTSLEEMQSMYGLVFLFKWQKNKGLQENLPKVDTHADHVFFANQVITNACATQAILSVLLNREDIDIGEELRNFKEFTQDFPPDMKGLAISNSDLIRSVHNSFARSDPFVNEIVDPNAGKDQDVFHFIAYTPVKGALFELDGLNRGPINLGSCDDSNWVKKANEAIKKRMDQYGASELHFSLMAIRKDRKEQYEEQMEELDALILSLPEGSEDGIRLSRERSVLSEKLYNENEKQQRWERENTLRKHNFIPLIYNLLTKLAEKDQLQPLITNAKNKAAAAPAYRK
ncbi:ubiquitin carboxyl-terminal hydrolase [Sporodiniella umbellata]|nr:ubiquitin carboxyl-terminal hydrolase [Sporodiniella umbellata]